MPDLLARVFMVAGALVVLIGALGLIRLPDFFTRLHAASVVDTLGLWLLMAGLILLSPSWVVTFKLVLILALVFVLSPLSAHVLARSALSSGLRPWYRHERTRRLRADKPKADKPQSMP